MTCPATELNLGHGHFLLRNKPTAFLTLRLCHLADYETTDQNFLPHCTLVKDPQRSFEWINPLNPTRIYSTCITRIRAPASGAQPRSSPLFPYRHVTTTIPFVGRENKCATLRCRTTSFPSRNHDAFLERATIVTVAVSNVSRAVMMAPTARIAWNFTSPVPLSAR